MQIKLSREFLESQLANLYPTKYNCYQWWRRYESRDLLPNKAPLYDKIKNGDYDFSKYLYQAEHELHLLEDKLKNLKCPEQRFDTTSLSMERYRRLILDYEKEESQITQKMKTDFKKVFNLSMTELESVMESFDGTVMELYDYLKIKKSKTEELI
jgi:hypothetical protein